MKPTHVCTECSRPCDIVEMDVGGYEEYWGAKVWCAAYEDYSDCCNSEVRELADDEPDIWEVVNEVITVKMREVTPVENQDEVDVYLNDLRESGVCNMFEAPSRMEEALGIPKEVAEKGFWYWADKFC